MTDFRRYIRDLKHCGYETDSRRRIIKKGILEDKFLRLLLGHKDARMLYGFYFLGKGMKSASQFIARDNLISFTLARVSRCACDNRYYLQNGKYQNPRDSISLDEI